MRLSKKENIYICQPQKSVESKAESSYTVYKTILKKDITKITKSLQE